MKLSRAAVAIAMVAAVAGVTAAELRQRTVEAFDHYVEVTEGRIQSEMRAEDSFLWVDRLGDNEREATYARLRAGEVVVEELSSRDAGGEIDVPDGLVHHWIGTVILPDVSLERVVAVMQDYDSYADIYAPQVRSARLLEREGDRFRVYAQLYEKKVLTFVANSEYEAEYIAVGESKMFVPSRTTRIQELEHPDTPDEREKPEGNDRGLLWRFNNYCSLEERAPDTLMQCESLSLTRGVPVLLSVLIRPFISGLPREKMAFTLGAIRRFLAGTAP